MIIPRTGSSTVWTCYISPRESQTNGRKNGAEVARRCGDGGWWQLILCPRCSFYVSWKSQLNKWILYHTVHLLLFFKTYLIWPFFLFLYLLNAVQWINVLALQFKDGPWSSRVTIVNCPDSQFSSLSVTHVMNNIHIWFALGGRGGVNNVFKKNLCQWYIFSYGWNYVA